MITRLYPPIMDDCRQLVLCFQQIQIKHCYRQANRCADMLAKMGVEQEIELLNHLSPPVDILQILQLGIGCMLIGPVMTLLFLFDF